MVAPKGNKYALGNKGGRPPIEFKEEYCQMAIDFLAEGFSIKAFAGSVNVSLEVIDRWRRENQEFNLAIKIGQSKASIWWEKTLKKNAQTGEGNATACIFGVKNRSRETWFDKQVIDNISSDGSMTPKDNSLAVLEAIKNKYKNDSE